MLDIAQLRRAFTPKKVLRYLLFAAAPAAIFYIMSLLVLSSAGFGITEILRDPAQQSGQSSFLGFVSNIGVWLWISTASICFFGAIRVESRSRERYGELLLLVGSLSLMLAVDDFFLIHDRYISQRVCYLTYALCVGALLARHHQLIFSIDGPSFLLAGTLLGLSIFTDIIQKQTPLSYEQTQVIEEGFKIIGAASWLFFGCSADLFCSAAVRESQAIANNSVD